jgi:predicted DNA-binding transcriptional regulator AlpA
MPARTSTPDAADLRRELGYITEEALAGLLGITVPTLRNRAAAGSLPPRYKLGRESVYRLAEVESFIKRRRVARGAPDPTRPSAA